MRKLYSETKTIFKEEGQVKMTTLSRIYYEDGSFDSRIHTTILDAGKGEATSGVND